MCRCLTLADAIGLDSKTSSGLNCPLIKGVIHYEAFNFSLFHGAKIPMMKNTCAVAFQLLPLLGL